MNKISWLLANKRCSLQVYSIFSFHVIDIDWVENLALNLFKLCYLLYKLLQVANTGMHFKYLSFSHSEKMHMSK